MLDILSAIAVRIDELSGMTILLSALASILLVCLYRLHRDKSRANFDLTDLVMQNGRVDKFAFWFAVWNTTLIVVVFYMVRERTMTEGFMTIILTAMVGPLISKVIWGKPPGTIISSSSTSIQQSSETPSATVTAPGATVIVQQPQSQPSSTPSN